MSGIATATRDYFKWHPRCLAAGAGQFTTTTGCPTNRCGGHMPLQTLPTALFREAESVFVAQIPFNGCFMLCIHVGIEFTPSFVLSRWVKVIVRRAIFLHVYVFVHARTHHLPHLVCLLHPTRKWTLWCEKFTIVRYRNKMLYFWCIDWRNNINYDIDYITD